MMNPIANATTRVSRRHFLQLTALAGGGLMIGCGNSLSGGDQTSQPPDPVTGDPVPLGDFIRILPNNEITVLIGASDVGQGIATGIAMVVAEELDADWNLVGVEASPVASEYANPFAGLQTTVGSASMRGYYLPQREVGALIRRLLVETAAELWSVPADSLSTLDSRVIDPGTSHSITYGELAPLAAGRAMPDSASLKPAGEFRLIGQDRSRLDNRPKLDGSLKYGIDFEIPDMAVAVLARPPRFGGRATRFDAQDSLQVSGVQDVVDTPAGVAVIADNFWAAEQGRRALRVTWGAVAGSRTDSEQQRQRYAALLSVPGIPTSTDLTALLPPAGAVDALEADFFFPFQAHAAMEPLNVVVDFDGSRARIWTGTQTPGTDKLHAQLVLGLRASAIEFNRLPSGGGFGRRGNWVGDYVRDACQVARMLRRPVKLMWTREDDMRGGYYRPMAAVRVRADLNAQGLPVSWHHRSVVQDLTLIDEFPAPESGFSTPPDNPSDTAESVPYAVGRLYTDLHLDVLPNMPALWMRGVNKVTDLFAQECFLDQIASRSDRDPLALRRQLLQERPELLGVLNQVAADAQWTPPSALPDLGAGRRAMGVAVLSFWGSHIAQIVDLSVDDDKRITLHQVFSAVDCGTAINPDLVTAQIESGIVFALSSIATGEITLVDGEVQQSNFHDYPVLRMFESPDMTTTILPSDRPPGGVGELGVPCVAPALANAVFAATGESIREWPMRHQGYSLAERHPESQAS